MALPGEANSLPHSYHHHLHTHPHGHTKPLPEGGLYRSHADSPLRKLTVDLIKTYRKINEVWLSTCVCVRVQSVYRCVCTKPDDVCVCVCVTRMLVTMCWDEGIVRGMSSFVCSYSYQ